SACGTALESVSAPGECFGLGAGHADARGPVLRLASAVRAPGPAERAARAAGLPPRARPQLAAPAVLMAILGISAHYHDSAAALVEDGVPVCAVQEERLSRRQNDAAFPVGAIEWCLDRAGVRPDQLEAVVFYEKPMLKFERILTMALRGFPRSWGSFPQAMKNALGDKLWVKGTIAAELGVPGDRILFTEHHRAHAAAAFFGAPTRKAAILTAAGVGEGATLTLGRGSVADAGGGGVRRG